MASFPRRWRKLQSLKLSAVEEPTEACPRCGKLSWRRTWFGRKGRVLAFVMATLAFVLGPPWGDSPYDFPEPNARRFQCRECGLTVLY
jgi:ribosomal protein S27AE